MTLSFPELSAEQLRRRSRIEQLGFASTAEAPELEEIIGQERATRAIDFGIEIQYPGYNIFAMGPAGAGKTSTIARFLKRKAETCEAPSDWGYVHNFADPDRPRALRLPAGGGAKLRDQVDALLSQIAETLPKVFVGEQYAEQRGLLERALDQQRNEQFRLLDLWLDQQGFELVRAQTGLMVVPGSAGAPMTQEQYAALPEAERRQLEERQPAAEEALERALRQVREIEEDAGARLSALDQKVAASAIDPLFQPLHQEYAAWAEVLRYLGEIQAHMVTNARAQVLHPSAEGQEPAQDERPPARPTARARSPLDVYRLNVIVDNQGLAGAPVILETNPTYSNLIGRVELRAEYGTLVTDFRQIKAGALHRANGGYLVLDVRMLLQQPGAWEALKQALRNWVIRMEEAHQQPGVLATTTLTPEPIPLDTKVVLIGDPDTYYALYAADQQFENLFKVRADFASDMDWTSENELKMVKFIRTRCAEEGLPHFDISAIARVIEYSARLVEDQRKLTTRFAHVADIVRESVFWAERAGHSLVTAEDVSQALAERIYRSNQYEERMREMIADGTIKVRTSGAVVGQVNGLAVLSLGDYAFGKPTRITARTYQGRAGVVNIEREARLSGRIHDKGVLILAGYLGGCFAQDKPLSLSASLAFEQSYDGVDGDSASTAELCALLSSLGDLPLRQDLAITGSVNQRGEVQAVGGVTAKIEGFFDVCSAAPDAPPGTQGVIMPASNVTNLMLRDEVIEAVAAGRFHIYPVESVDQCMEILSGLPAGERDAEGGYPADTVNGRVDRQLHHLAERLEQFGRNGRGTSDDPSAGSGSGRGTSDEPESPHEPELPGDRPREF